MQCLKLNVTKCEDSIAGGLCGALEEFDNRILNLSAKPYRVMTSFRIDSLKHMQLHTIKQCSELVACHISYYCVMLIICQGGQHRCELWHYLVVKMFDSDEIYSTNLIYWSMTLSICCQSLDNTTNSTLILQSVTTKQEVKNGDRPISKIYGLHSPGKSNLARRRLIVQSNMYENV